MIPGGTSERSCKRAVRAPFRCRDQTLRRLQWQERFARGIRELSALDLLRRWRYSRGS